MRAAERGTWNAQEVSKFQHPRFGASVQCCWLGPACAGGTGSWPQRPHRCVWMEPVLVLLLYFLTLCAVACTSKPEGPTRLCAGHNNCPGFWLIIGASEGCCFGQDCWPGIVGRTRLVSVCFVASQERRCEVARPSALVIEINGEFMD